MDAGFGVDPPLVAQIAAAVGGQDFDYDVGRAFHPDGAYDFPAFVEDDYQIGFGGALQLPRQDGGHFVKELGGRRVELVQVIV